MKLLIDLVKILFAIYLFAFAGAVVGGFVGLVLFGLQLLDIDHVLWFVGVAAPLFVVWGFLGNGNGSSVAAHAEREPKAKRLFASSDLFDDGPFIEMPPHGGIWRV
jgi:hypothetical protein